MNILWITDPHLNFLPSVEASRTLGGYLAQEHSFDAVVISGDIAEAPDLRSLLNAFADGVAPRPVYFVLGNHDYYRGSFASVRRALSTGMTSNLIWLDHAGVRLLDDDTALMGHQGWFDARLGDAENSRVIMNDFEVIADLREHYVGERAWISGGRAALLAKLRELGTQAANAAHGPLLDALRVRNTVIFVTHFPPFREACWYQGATSNDDWSPWFTCQAMGAMLSETARAHPRHRILVLCGHTHSEGVYDHAPNLRVLTGKAVYGAPEVAGVLKTPIAGWSAPCG